jgi:hypothetical protein
VVVLRTGVVKSGLDISDVPPVGTSNQSIIPAETPAWRLTTLPAQIVAPDAVGACGGGVTVALTGIGELTQPVGLVTTT